MMKPAFSKTLLAPVFVLALICMAKPASARHNGGSKGGGSHSGKSHGGGSFHGGGRSKGASFKAPSFNGGGHSYTYGGSRGNARVSSARMGGGSKNNGNKGRTSGGSYGKSAGFSSRPFGNFSRSSNLGDGSFGPSGSSRNFERSGGSQSMTQGSRGAVRNWQSFGNSSGRQVLASARPSENAMGGWRAYGNTVGHGGGAATAYGNGSSSRAGGQWRSFGNSRNTSFGRNISGFSSFNGTRATGSSPQSGSFGFGSNRFSPDMSVSTRFSSFSPFSGRSIGRFEGSRFGDSRFGYSGFGNSSFGGSGFFNAGIGSGLSLFPNLLGGFLNIGTSLFGGPAVLAANALSVAVQLFVSGIEASGTGQGNFLGGDAGFGQNGFGGSFGPQVAPVAPACGPGNPLFAAGPAWGAFCQPYAYQPFGLNSVGYFAAPRFGFRVM